MISQKTSDLKDLKDHMDYVTPNNFDKFVMYLRDHPFKLRRASFTNINTIKQHYMKELVFLLVK